MAKMLSAVCSVRDELVRRGIDIQWLGYVPTKPMKEQAERILNALGVEILRK